MQNTNFESIIQLITLKLDCESDLTDITKSFLAESLELCNKIKQELMLKNYQFANELIENNSIFEVEYIQDVSNYLEKHNLAYEELTNREESVIQNLDLTKFLQPIEKQIQEIKESIINNAQIKIEPNFSQIENSVNSLVKESEKFVLEYLQRNFDRLTKEQDQHYERFVSKFDEKIEKSIIKFSNTINDNLSEVSNELKESVELVNAKHSAINTKFLFYSVITLIVTIVSSFIVAKTIGNNLSSNVISYWDSKIAQVTNKCDSSQKKHK